MKRFLKVGSDSKKQILQPQGRRKVEVRKLVQARMNHFSFGYSQRVRYGNVEKSRVSR